MNNTNFYDSINLSCHNIVTSEVAAVTHHREHHMHYGTNIDANYSEHREGSKTQAMAITC